jgi:hypothetical protein
MDVCLFSLKQFFTELNAVYPIKSKVTDATYIVAAVYSDAFVRVSMYTLIELFIQLT